jgi:hypothetical protein
MILKTFCGQKKLEKKIDLKNWPVCLKLQLLWQKIMIIRLVFEKNAIFSPENGETRQKCMMVMALTPCR